MEDYIHVLGRTISKHCRHVKEVIFAKVDAYSIGPVRQWRSQGIDFKILDHPLTTDPDPKNRSFLLMVAGHGSGLHHAIDNATQEYVWLTDPDVFLFSSVDDLYLSLMEKHNLGIIGISHFTPQQQCYLDFPCVTNCLLRKGSLPPPEWLAEELGIYSGMKPSDKIRKLAASPGEYLLPGPNSHYGEFPSPDGMFDVGFNLWFWGKQNNWKWLSFYRDAGLFPINNEQYGFRDLVYPMNYTAADYRTNFGLQDDLGQQELLYHRTMAVGQPGSSYRQLYESLFGTEDAWSS